MRIGKQFQVLNSISVFLILSLALSCSIKKNDSTRSELDSLVSDIGSSEDNEDYTFKSEKLLSYKDFIDHLDPFDVGNMTVAADKFKSEFKDENEHMCDSAYFIFERYYALTDDRINETLSKDTADFNSLLEWSDSLSSSTRISEKLKDYVKNLDQNGFGIASTEGTPYIEKDRNFIKKKFYTKLTPVMVEYLDQLQKETEQGYWDDGGLTISSGALVDRIIWWEFFIKQHSDFIFKNLPKEKKQIYLISLMNGEDNTPLFTDENQKELDPYFKEAYSYLFSKQSNSETAKELKPYYYALLKNDTSVVNSIRRKMY